MYIKRTVILIIALAFALGGCAQQGGESTSGASSTPAGTLAPSGSGAASPTGATSPGAAQPIDGAEGRRIAEEWLQNCLDGEFTAAYDACDANMKAFWDQGGGIENMWPQLTTQLGDYESHAFAQQAFSGEYCINILDMEYSASPVQASVTVDPAGKIAGVFITPAAAEPEKSALPAALREQSITVDAGTGYPLDGLITYPADGENLPCAILVQGSGASGMDQVVGQNRTFEQLAHGLAEQGLAVIRFDKRNSAYPAITQQPDYSVEDEYIEDFRAAIELAISRPECDPERVFLVGHSQGGMLAPRIAEGTKAAGMVIMAGTPRGLIEILQDQQELAAADYEAAGEQAALDILRENQQAWLAEYEALQGMSAEQAKQARTVYSFPAWYIYDMLNHTPALDLIRQSGRPVFIIQGEKDVQVYADKDFQLYQDGLAGYEQAEFKLYPGLNHLFMPSQAEGISAALQEYEQPSKMDPAVIADIAAWILRQ